MGNKFIIPIILLIIIIWAGEVFSFTKWNQTKSGTLLNEVQNSNPTEQNATQPSPDTNPLSIVAMRSRSYPGSELKIERELTSVSNYKSYVASYQSNDLTIYGLLTVPTGKNPSGGWPVMIFNHGYIDPVVYSTNGSYKSYMDVFARNGYIVFKPDYRGNGNSEGEPDSAYYSPGYATDVLNAIATMKKYPGANPERIGMWGHSMGGNITLRSLVVDTQDVKAAVIWGGVVGSYNDLMNNWQRKVRYHPAPRDLALRNNHRKVLVDEYGMPASNPTFWQALDPTAHLGDVNTPIQLHTGDSDEEVPVAFSVSLNEKLKAAGKTVEYYNYPGGNHNISGVNFTLAMQRSVEWFDQYLK